jgi:hypothetical protein
VTSRALAAVVLLGVGVEVGSLVVAGGWVAWQLVAGRADAPGTAGGLVGLAVILAAGLALAGLALVRRGSGAARAVVVTWQLVQVGSAGTIIGAAVASQAVVAAAWGAAALAAAVVVASVADAWRADRTARSAASGG